MPEKATPKLHPCGRCGRDMQGTIHGWTAAQLVICETCAGLVPRKQTIRLLQGGQTPEPLAPLDLARRKR
jgi:hypothetical protein